MPPSPAARDPKAHPFFGKTIARCKVGEALGRGRTSWVCRAHYEPLDREVAIKILAGDMAEIAEIRERFLAEARAIAQLDHPHIVKVIDVVEDQGHLCILMEYVAGDTLQQRLDQGGALPVRKALRIALQVAEALAAAHAEKIVHRDVKPANVLLVTGSDEVKVVDFGLAGPKLLANRTGTPLYMSPEACQGKRIDEKSDVYALGITLYQMLVGRLPHDGQSVKEILASHIKGEYVLPSKARPQLGSTYDDVVRKLLVAAKGYRPTAEEAAALLAPLAAQGGGESSGGRGGSGGARGGRRPAARPARKGPGAGVVIGSVLGVIALAVAGLLLLRKEPPAPPPEPPPVTPANDGDAVKPPPEPPAKDAATKAFEAVEDWADAHPNEWAETAKRWREFLAKHPGSKWEDRAKHSAEFAEGKAGIERPPTTPSATDAAAEIEKERKARLAAQAEQRKEFEGLMAVYDFDAASKLADDLPNADGESIADWRLRKHRIAYLAEEFQKRLNEGVKDRRLPASKLKPDAGADEVIAECDAAGVATRAGDLPRRIPWSEVKPEAVYGFMRSQVVSQRDVDGQVFMAVLAAELGLAKQCAEHRDLARAVDAVGDSEERLLQFFRAQ